MSDRIKESYQSSKNIYDDVLTQSTWWGRLYIRLFWGGVDDNEIARDLLARIPQGFSGALLDVPVGTAVFTEETYKRLPNARIVCLDYSEDMLEQARARFENRSLSHVTTVQGDVGSLAFEDGAFDTVLSMNGFHAFPDKDAAYREVVRVLRPGGTFLACFYLQGESWITDLLVRRILAPKGWFTPPFETEESLRARLETSFELVHFEVRGSMVLFEAKKRA